MSNPRPAFSHLGLIFSSAIFLTGCAHTSFVTPSGTPDTYSYEQFNEIIKDKEVTINLQKERVWDATQIILISDTLSWTNSKNQKQESAHIVQVRSIEFRNRSKGLVDGLIWGGASSVLVLLVYPSTRGGGDLIVYTAGEKYVMAGTVLSVSILSGVIFGTTDRYVPRPNEGSSSQSQNR